ncbi:Chromosome partition protein Smc [Lasiodiplodia hormozganensis]|uniref:Chromosome partition protein Smc n=1 Tax=Lasiodiplodia hormozganensis TaxID=869390 RepID=A0AA39W9S2_9PEZI|nr:Chromosome partition protein Smc [Lasiodiplodia hormozganensis]
MSGLSKLRAYAGLESPDAAKNHLFVNPRSRRPISAAEVSIPGANTTDSKAYHRLGTGRLRLLSDDDSEVDSFEGQDFSLNAKIATLERMNAKLKDENRKFELTTSQLKGDNDKLKSEIDKIKSENNQLKEDNDKLKGEKIKLKDNNIKLTHNIGDLKDDNALLDGENNKLKGENIKLNEDNEKLKDKNDSLESQLSCHDDLISSLKDEISERGATLNSSRNFAHEVIVGFLTSGYNLPDGLPDHLTATYENAMEMVKSITKELGPKKLPKHDAGPGSSMSPTISGKSTDGSNGRVRKGPLLDEPVAKRLKRVHDLQCASQSTDDDILRAKDSEMDDETSLRSFSSDTADDDHEEV